MLWYCPSRVGRVTLERWTDVQLVKVIVVILVIIWGVAMLMNGPLDRLLSFFGMSFSPH